MEVDHDPPPILPQPRTHSVSGLEGVMDTQQDEGLSSEFFIRIFFAIVCAAGAIGIVVFSTENTTGAIAFPFVICVAGFFGAIGVLE